MEATYAAARQTGLTFDWFMFGNDPLGLLLGWGDMVAMRAGAAKVVGTHKRALARVREGGAPIEECVLHRACTSMMQLGSPFLHLAAPPASSLCCDDG